MHAGNDEDIGEIRPFEHEEFQYECGVLRCPLFDGGEIFQQIGAINGYPKMRFGLSSNRFKELESLKVIFGEGYFSIM